MSSRLTYHPYLFHTPTAHFYFVWLFCKELQRYHFFKRVSPFISIRIGLLWYQWDRSCTGLIGVEKDRILIFIWPSYKVQSTYRVMPLLTTFNLWMQLKVCLIDIWLSQEEIVYVIVPYLMLRSIFQLSRYGR